MPMGKSLSVIQFRNFLPFNFDEYPIFTNSGIESICFLPAIWSIAKNSTAVFSPQQLQHGTLLFEIRLEYASKIFSLASSRVFYARVLCSES